MYIIYGLVCYIGGKFGGTELECYGFLVVNRMNKQRGLLICIIYGLADNIYGKFVELKLADLLIYIMWFISWNINISIYCLLVCELKLKYYCILMVKKMDKKSGV